MDLIDFLCPLKSQRCFTGKRKPEELGVWLQAGKRESVMLLWLQRRPGPFEAFLNVPR